MSDDLQARVELLERHIDWLYRNAGFPAPYSHPRAGGAPAHDPQSQLHAEVLDLLRRGRKIQAIALYRDQTGVGLKEAKDAVESLE